MNHRSNSGNIEQGKRLVFRLRIYLPIVIASFVVIHRYLEPRVDVVLLNYTPLEQTFHDCSFYPLKRITFVRSKSQFKHETKPFFSVGGVDFLGIVVSILCAFLNLLNLRDLSNFTTSTLARSLRISLLVRLMQSLLFTPFKLYCR